MTATAPSLVSHGNADTGGQSPALLWQLPAGVRCVSSAVLGGGMTSPKWIANVQVSLDYRRTDPAAHLHSLADHWGIDPDAGVGLLTAARVRDAATATERGVRCDATVGLSVPTYAAAPAGTDESGSVWRPGTINIVCQFPTPLVDAALVGAVLTATEAKAQALIDAGVPGTGTASDAIVICCPSSAAESSDAGSLMATAAAPELYAGPRSGWGSVLARVVYAAVTDGTKRYAARHI